MPSTWEAMEGMLVATARSLGILEIDALDFAHDSIWRLVERYAPSVWRDPLDDKPTKEAFGLAAKICTNLVRDHWRSGSRKLGIAVGGIDFSMIAWDRDTCMSDWSGATLLRNVLTESMPDLHRRVVEHSLAGLTQAEIADRVKAPLGTVKSVLHRLKKRAMLGAVA